ncbi:hypothetical protein E1293_40050 [Actinomadura darangshiensis]|uniref:DUF4190 domain-containing protein n=1 Tax=Actinomadura darangshiensis TaxID=705336 RepID=A0A4R5A4Q0_9ACTN|nr:hypothetical protein [Actinomadura darangshiensis]TDD65654.1 hypothetical protein E1293_40050 [Actinomadura darangshiensis]
MSGYGGSPPPGWQGPYDGSQGYAGTPYAGGPQPGYDYGPPGVPVRRPASGSTIACLVCNIIGVLVCCGILSVPGAIVAALAMGRAETDPVSARKLTIAGWVLYALSVFFGIIIGIIYIVYLVNSEPNYGSTSGI